MDELVSVPEAARRLGGLAESTIYNWFGSGKLQRSKVGRRTMVRLSELARMVEDGGKSEHTGRYSKRLSTHSEDTNALLADDQPAEITSAA
jgi:hypothetical protein